MAESSAIPHLQGLEIEAVEWLPSGADSGLVRVRGRWSTPSAAQPGLPELLLRADGADHRFESLPDARFARDPMSWRGSYLVPGTLVATEPEALWIEWPGGVRCGLPGLARGLAAPPPAPAEPAAGEQGGQVIERAVLAERRARRAEAAEREQARVAAEALKAVEALELQSAELERRLAETTAERDALASATPAAEPAAPADRRPSAGGDAPARPPAPAGLPAPAGGARAASSVGRARAASDPSAEELARLAERRPALASAFDSLARLRAQSREWRLALRTGEMARSGDAVRLAVLEAERALGEASPRGALKARTRELAEERARAESLERVRADLDAGLAEARDEAAAARAELEAAREQADARLAAAIAAAEATREELERRRRGEHAVHEEVRAELGGRLEAAESRANALEAAQAELAADRDSASARAESLGARIAELETALAAAETGLATADASAANAQARLRVESVARAALEAELDRAREGGDAAALAAELQAERAARAAERDALAVERDPHASAFAEQLAAELEAGRAARAGAETARATAEADLAAAEAARSAAEAALTAARAENRAVREALEESRAGFGAELAAARETQAAAEAALAEAFAAAARQGQTLQDRIAELERGAAGLADEVRLANAAREQAEAAAAAAPPAEQSGRMLADLDAAAAALRDAAPAPPAEAPQPAAAAANPDFFSPGLNKSGLEAPEARVRPRIVSAAGPPPRVHATGRSARDYPRLRGAIVKLAHDDPVAAAQLLVALLPAQAAALAAQLDYDLTIAEAGTFAVTIDGPVARVDARPAPRGRGHAEFHLSADALTLAELLAGVDHRIGRWRGPARFSGSRRKLDVLRSLPAAKTSLTEAARAGAELEPALVYRTLSYAVHPSWTRGERFTLAQEITGTRPETWYLSARDGAGMTVSANPPEDGIEATVSMPRHTFGLMLRDEPVPSGERPVVRGDHRVVALVKAWMDRAQHGGV